MKYRWKVADALRGAAHEAGHPVSATIALLAEEIEDIHFANKFYWDRTGAATPEARAERERRKERLEAIRSELYQLQSS